MAREFAAGDGQRSGGDDRTDQGKATELGADMVGVCRLQPHMIDLGSEVSHEFVIACCVAEDYEKVIQGRMPSRKKRCGHTRSAPRSLRR